MLRFPTGRTLFGDAYSGLEYDYRGLMRLYEQTHDYDKANEYELIMSQWRVLRDNVQRNEKTALELEGATEELDSVLDQFFEDGNMQVES